MPEPIDLASARARRWDVVIVGTSFAAAFFARGLPAGLSVLMVEKGRRVSFEAWGREMGRVREPIAQRNASGEAKDWVAHTVFGGNSNCWWACAPRLAPSDFRLKSLYGLGEDWPLSYGDLEPFYEEAEEIMEVNGGGSDHLLPRRRPFPFPPHEPSDSDRLLRAWSRDWFAQPSARATGGSRAPCCANGVCHLCPIDSKFTVSNGAGRLFPEGARLLEAAEARVVLLEGGRAVGIGGRAEGGEFEIRADLVALGANAIFNPAIMLRSGLAHPWLGAGLNEQVSRVIRFDGPPELGFWGGTSITGHGYHLHDGPRRKDRAAILIELHNAPPSIRPEIGRWTDAVTLKFIAEDLPQRENRVVLEADEPMVEWRGHHPYALRALDGLLDDVSLFLPFEPSNVEELYRPGSEAHIIGTHRMGADPEASVVDDRLRCHSTPGLLALGSGAFPTCSPANPSLTIAALSLRAGRLL